MKAKEAKREMPTEKVQWSAEERAVLFNEFEVQDVFRHDKRHNRDSVSRFSLGGRYGGLPVDGSLREKRETYVWMMRQRDYFSRDKTL
jgi:hypothetical protein